jgi:hypothetical protein
MLELLRTLPAEYSHAVLIFIQCSGRLWDTDSYGPRMSGLQFGLSKTFVIHERFKIKIMIRAESNNWPLKLPEPLLPNAVYNSNSAKLLGTFTSLRIPFADPGMSRPPAVVGGHIESFEESQ